MLDEITDENGRAGADGAPADDHGRFVAALGAPCLLPSLRGGAWNALAIRAVIRRLAAFPSCREIQLSYHPENAPAARLCAELGCAPTGDFEDEEAVAARGVASPIA
ncbi:hypothetical protein [Streptomyces flavofungini]|uniref:hypothetical protein n=1 Tax=Streptomyces flavofungini TaxID=68200 RepID=UPI0019C534DA|nr:hypothetical protein [Streptomyces flavofungini]GHC67083.1 hypothetical protein GCM10010349_39700 [Streptomyces flavofungini]